MREGEGRVRKSKGVLRRAGKGDAACLNAYRPTSSRLNLHPYYPQAVELMTHQLSFIESFSEDMMGVVSVYILLNFKLLKRLIFCI